MTMTSLATRFLPMMAPMLQGNVVLNEPEVDVIGHVC